MDKPTARNDLKRYFKEIKSLLPVYSKEEKKFLTNLMRDVDSYIEENPDSDYMQYISQFGEPKDIASRYIADADSNYLLSQIKTSKYIKIGVLIIIIAFVIGVASVITIHYIDFVKAQESYIAREVTEITYE